MVWDGDAVGKRRGRLEYDVTSDLMHLMVSEGPFEAPDQFAPGQVAGQFHVALTTSSRTR